MPLNEETYINKEENAMEKNNVESLVLYNIMEQRITGAATGEKNIILTVFIMTMIW